MPVQVPFHLLRVERPGVCAGLLLLSTEIEDLLELCGRVGTEPLPPIFPVQGGFLVIADEIPRLLPPKTIRLRRLSENCYLPVDADLVPALHPDEAVDLTRQRGLVFLPGEQCLAFQPDQPLSAIALIRLPTLKRGEWQPFPNSRGLADRLTTITRIVPEITPEDILGAGGEGIGEENPRPPKAGVLKTAAGKIAMGVGKGIAGAGIALGLGALARLGAGIIGAAAAAVPRLTEALLGKQEAALRELLRKFREGRIDEALKNALPIGGNESGGLNTGDQLPTHDVKWSLTNIMGAHGAGGLWMVGADLQRELAAEYRKAAQAAIARGDHRRAAFIYAKLLHDPRTAADVLSKGGLHRDAAILYRDLLKEPRWAAREFEAAGEFDEAVRLYRQIGAHEQAGDLLRRMGEEEEAIDEYHTAARKIVDDQRDYLKAGDLLLRKTGRADLAGAYFAIGWRERDKPANVDNAVPCAIRLAEIYAFAEPLDPFWTHLDEVEQYLAKPGNLPATANFFNTIAKLADLPHLYKHRADLRDRCKLALAGKLREHYHRESRPGNAVSDLFGRSGHWPAAVVSDANHALRRALANTDANVKSDRPFTTVRLGNDTVTATGFAPDAGDIIVGFANGQVVGFHPQSGQCRLIAHKGAEPIEAISVDNVARAIVTLSSYDAQNRSLRLRAYQRNEHGHVDFCGERDYWMQAPGWFSLNPVINRIGDVTHTWLSTPAGMIDFSSAALIPRGHGTDEAEAHASVYLKIPLANTVTTCGSGPVLDSGASLSVGPRELWHIVFEDRTVIWGGVPIAVGWRPAHVGLSQPQLAWLQPSLDQLELAGIDEIGTLHWSEIAVGLGETKAEHRTLASRTSVGHRAAAIWKPGMVIGVTAANLVCWLRATRTGFQEWSAPTHIPVPAKAVACFPSHATDEVVIVLADGEAVRLAVPV
jgi:tetratricopeptide (TPR) repeat protein